MCDSGKEGCMMGKLCTKCPNWLDDIKEDAPLDKLVKWSHWERVTNSMVTKQGKPKTIKKIQKTIKEGTVEEALNCLQEKIPSFLQHVFVKRKQSAFFEDCIANLKEDEAILQVDFS